ncbi:MAG: ABC transporter ATP-binding protein [Candidatus Paceibacterota bacterium]
MNNKNLQKDYSLNNESEEGFKRSARGAVKKIFPMLAKEKRYVIISLVATLLNSLFNLIGPLLIGYSVDAYIVKNNYSGVLRMGLILLVVYFAAFAANYIQMRVMGGVAQRVLWSLRNNLFAKLQELPLSFFNQNKSGDLISRINSDTEKVNEFFSQSLMRFAGNIFMILGTGIFILSINFKLAIVSLVPAVFILIFTKLISSWVGKKNKESLSARGLLSADIQESISNFKVILAFNRRDYFRTRFEKINNKSFKSSMGAGFANELFTPVFEFMGNVALILMLGYGIYLVSIGQFAVGFLVSFVIYITRFYDPLREMARLWATLQSALAAWDRIGKILSFTSDLAFEENPKKDGKGIIEFRDVSFSYLNGNDVLKNINFVLEKGKKYALVGPTGGGKTTTASLVARLFDPTEGVIYLDGKDVRSYHFDERAQKIGFILQEPYLFSGTVRENLMYGFSQNKNFDILIKEAGFDNLLSRFPKGLNTQIDSTESLSLGEKQIIAFMRAVLRAPDVLILDEATANIDTVTEKILNDILKKLPEKTTQIIIAHRLNTIEGADNIFFINGTKIVEAGSMEQAVEMLLHNKRES